MDAIKNIIDATIDYEGQKKAYEYQNFITKWGAILSLFFGFTFQKISVTVYGFIATGILAAIVIVYPWDCYRKNPISWQVPGLQSQEELSKNEGEE